MTPVYVVELLDKEGTGGDFAQTVRGLREDQLCKSLAFASLWTLGSSSHALIVVLLFRFRPEICQSLEPEFPSQSHCPECGRGSPQVLPFRAVAGYGGYQGAAGRTHTVH